MKGIIRDILLACVGAVIAGAFVALGFLGMIHVLIWGLG